MESKKHSNVERDWGLSNYYRFTERTIFS